MAIILKEETRYPKKGDKFFIDTGNQNEIAWLNKAFQKFGSYADSYQTGAICLIDSALINSDLRDLNIYPAIFLFRHYLELRLKELIQGLNFCKEQNNNFPKHHDLSSLWSEFKTSYSSIGENSNDETFKVIDELILEMNSIDPISMAFRYPVDKEGKNIQKLEFINISNLRETFVRISFLFDGVALQIAHYVDITESMLQDVYENYWYN